MDIVPSLQARPRLVAAASVRFFCDLERSVHLRQDEYLRLFHRTMLGVRAIPITGMVISTRMPPVWRELARCFDGPVAPRYLNVVCAMPGHVLGKRMKAAQMAPPAPRGFAGQMGDPGGGASPARPVPQGDEVIYEPDTALRRFWTAGVVNVAITAAPVDLAQHPDRGVTDPYVADLAELHRYDLVMAPTDLDRMRIASAGADHEVKVVMVDAGMRPGWIRDMLVALDPALVME